MKKSLLGKKAFFLLLGFIALSGIQLILFIVLPALAFWGCVAGNVVYGLVAVYLYRLWFRRSLKELHSLSLKIVGLQAAKDKDELLLATDALSKLTGENERAIAFINAIGDGELDTRLSAEDFATSAQGSLGSALLKMRTQLREVAEKERERNWVTEKLASFSELFRTSSDSLPDFCNAILSKLVKYLEANQAAIFILKDAEGQEPALELVACYAFDRKKWVTKTVQIGEGLLGQTFLEKEALYMTDIPQGYTRITSGLGDATPSCLLLVPIKQNEEVLGMLELASFKNLLPYQIEFIEKISEGIASSISTTKIRERTAKLLEESLAQTHELKAQEEEMRQNMEELQATQEASYRMQEELRRNEQSHLGKIEELSRARQTMQEQELKLKESQEKAQKRSLRFKEKMEALDIEIEGKNAQLKTLMKQLQTLQEKYGIEAEELIA